MLQHNIYFRSYAYEIADIMAVGHMYCFISVIIIHINGIQNIIDERNKLDHFLTCLSPTFCAVLTQHWPLESQISVAGLGEEFDGLQSHFVAAAHRRSRFRDTPAPSSKMFLTLSFSFECSNFKFELFRKNYLRSGSRVTSNEITSKNIYRTTSTELGRTLLG